MSSVAGSVTETVWTRIGPTQEDFSIILVEYKGRWRPRTKGEPTYIP